jgi:hypothetical protein
MTASRPDLSLALRWLLSHPEPAVRYRARLWLEGRAPGDPLVRAERELLVTGPVVAEVLARQAPDGSWHGPAFYVPKHRSTFHVLAALAEMGLTRRAAGGRPSSAAPVPCLTARAAAFLAEMGYADDPRLERAVSYLVSRQRPDGGWSCLQRAVRRGEPVAKGCLGVTAAFLDLAEKTPCLLGGHPATLAAARFVEALYLRDPKGYHVADTWKELASGHNRPHPAGEGRARSLPGEGPARRSLGHRRSALPASGAGGASRPALSVGHAQGGKVRLGGCEEKGVKTPWTFPTLFARTGKPGT